MLRKTLQFIKKICKGDMNRQPKTAKINLGPNHIVLHSGVTLTWRTIMNL